MKAEGKIKAITMDMKSQGQELQWPKSSWTQNVATTGDHRTKQKVESWKNFYLTEGVTSFKRYLEIFFLT